MSSAASRAEVNDARTVITPPKEMQVGAAAARERFIAHAVSVANDLAHGDLATGRMRARFFAVFDRNATMGVHHYGECSRAAALEAIEDLRVFERAYGFLQRAGGVYSLEVFDGYGRRIAARRAQRFGGSISNWEAA